MTKPNLRIKSELVPLIEQLIADGCLDDFEVEADGLSIDGLHCYHIRAKGEVERETENTDNERVS